MLRCGLWPQSKPGDYLPGDSPTRRWRRPSLCAFLERRHHRAERIKTNIILKREGLFGVIPRGRASSYAASPLLRCSLAKSSAAFLLRCRRASETPAPVRSSVASLLMDTDWIIPMLLVGHSTGG